MLNPDLINNKQLVREQLRQPFVILENALIPEMAEKLYDELIDFDGWCYQNQRSLSEKQIAYQEKHAPGYTFSRYNLQFGVDKLPPSLQQFYRYLVSPPVLQWMADVSGRSCDDFEGGAALLKEGGHIAEHNDYGIFKQEDGITVTRALTFNYYLTRNWHSEWGGNFVWKKPYTKVVPGFNALVMFLVGQNSNHFVEAVSPLAREDRLAITGWFRTVRNTLQLGRLELQR
ncbi:MAG: 2OG-Fe(II) oxygenase family protein [Thiotrichaceae bacterium]